MEVHKNKGRAFLIAFTVIVVLLEVSLKGCLLYLGTLKGSQAIGTVVTFGSVWALWFGSRFAYWFMVVGISLGAIFILVVGGQIPAPVVFIIMAVAGLLLFLLSASDTRNFMASRRKANALNT